MKFCLEKTCAWLVAAGEREGCHCPCPGGRRGGPLWTQAPARRVDICFQGQLLYLGGRSGPGERWGLHTSPWSEVEKRTASSPAEKLLSEQEQSCLLSIFPAVT